MKRLIPTLLLFFALAVIPAASAFAEATAVRTVLGSDGELITLLNGTYGEFFPSGNAADAEVPVLAIQRTSPDGQHSVELVPSTLDQDRESAAELVVEPSSGFSYVFWQSWSNLIQSRFRISAFDGDSWSDPIEISDSGFVWRTSPDFVVTHDQFSDLAEDGSTRVTRTVLHIVWSEESHDARWLTMYAPLVLENGRYVGQHPVLVLNDLMTDDNSGPSIDQKVEPTIRSRSNENSVVTAFLDQRSGQIVTAEIRFAAGELSIIGDEVSDVLAQHSVSGNFESLLIAVNDRLRKFSEEVRPEILEPLATEIGNFILDQGTPGESGIANVHDGARPHLIDFGFRATANDIRRVYEDARPHLIDFGVRGGSEDKSGPEVRHDARLSLIMHFSPPQGDSAPELLLSNSGRQLMLVWAGEDRVRFQESLPDGTWGGMQQIELTDEFDLPAVMDVLKQRVDQR